MTRRDLTMIAHGEPARGRARPRAWEVAVLAGVGLALVLGADGCAADFDPPSWLVETRVLAVAATPLDVTGDGEIALTATVFVPRGTAVVREEWRVCPLSQGPHAGYACVAAACEVPLDPGPDGVVRTRPLPLLLDCVAHLQARGAAAGEPAPALDPAALPESVEIVYRHELEDDSGLVRETLLRLPLWLEGPPDDPNRAPVIAAVEIGGAVVTEGAVAAPLQAGDEVTVRVRVDPDSLDLYRDVDGDERREEPIVAFYATAGRFDGDRKAGPTVETTFRAVELDLDDLDLAGAEGEPGGDGDSEAALWVVVLDLRGGQAVAGPFRIPIRR